MNKKRALLLLVLMALLLTGCGADREKAPETAESAAVPELLNQTEYLLYQNIFYNDYGPQYDGRETEKKGVYTKIHDAWNDRDRYYVWGYLDATHCCDWQWEIVPTDLSALPAPGSLVTVKGTFAKDENALDGYWIRDAKVTAETRYTGQAADIAMDTMSCTLERVQMLNILYHPDVFEGKRFTAYGRVAGVNTLEDPYYDGSWQIPFTTGADCPAIGTLIRLQGTVKDGTLDRCTLETMK